MIPPARAPGFSGFSGRPAGHQKRISSEREMFNRKAHRARGTEVQALIADAPVVRKGSQKKEESWQKSKKKNRIEFKLQICLMLAFLSAGTVILLPMFLPHHFNLNQRPASVGSSSCAP